MHFLFKINAFSIIGLLFCFISYNPINCQCQSSPCQNNCICTQNSVAGTFTCTCTAQ